MKNVTALVALLLLAVGGNCQMNDLPEAMKNFYETCMNKLNISKEDQMSATQMTDYKSNPKLRCLSDCLMTESGIIKDNTIDVEKIKEIMTSYNPSVEEADIDEIHSKCVAQGQQKGDKCDFANEYGTCTKSVYMKAQ